MPIAKISGAREVFTSASVPRPPVDCLPRLAYAVSESIHQRGKE